jgi:hypothetical protein
MANFLDNLVTLLILKAFNFRCRDVERVSTRNVLKFLKEENVLYANLRCEKSKMLYAQYVE